KVLDDQSIDAISIATPNFHHTLQTIWGVQAGKEVFVEKACSYNMFEAQQIIAASRKYNRIVQNGTGAQAWLHEAKKRLNEGLIGDVYMARGLCFKWRDTIGRAEEEPPPPGVSYDLWIGPAPPSRSRATASTTTGTGSGTTATATSAIRAPIRS